MQKEKIDLFRLSSIKFNKENTIIIVELLLKSIICG